MPDPNKAWSQADKQAYETAFTGPKPAAAPAAPPKPAPIDLANGVAMAMERAMKAPKQDPALHAIKLKQLEQMRMDYQRQNNGADLPDYDYLLKQIGPAPAAPMAGAPGKAFGPR